MRSILLIRHGISEHNARKTTDLDSSLTQDGHNQTKMVAEFLKDILDVSEWECLVSPYLRTLQTAKILKESLNLDFMVDERPREVMVKYEGVKIPNRADQFPEFCWEGIPKQGYFFGNETEDEFCDRMLVLKATLPPDGKFLIVSHGSPVEVLGRIEAGEKNELPPTWVDNSSLTLIVEGKKLWYNRVVY